MFFYYRISNNSYLKEKLPGISKRECLKNFLSFFKNGIILADNCDQDTLDMISGMTSGNITLHQSNLGNAGSLKWCIDHALLGSNDMIYFAEDDYLHSNKSLELVNDWLDLRDDISYATLYDHPDKYSSLYNYGETSKVYKNRHHWRLTQSTTMTFLTKKVILKEDYSIWEKYLTNTFHPLDHQIFTDLLKMGGRKLVCAIPGSAVHTDLSVSINFHKNLIDDWALEIAYFSLIQKINDLNDKNLSYLVSSIVKDDKDYWDKIKLLNAILFSS